MNQIEMTLAVSAIKDSIPKDASLIDRIKFSMKYVREYEHNIFWMSHSVSDDTMFKASLAAVMVISSEEDKEAITRSLQPLKMLSAVMNGVPVDFSQMPTDDLIPLMKLWDESKR